MTTAFKVTEKLAAKVLSVIDAGLVSGIGEPVPGQMCVEAAVCYAMDLPHSDRPTCVSSALRELKIAINDKSWSSDAARADGLRRLGIAQLGSMGKLDDKDFLSRVATMTIKVFVSNAMRSAASLSKTHKKELEEHAAVLELDPSIVNARAAQETATAAYAAYAASAAAYAAHAAANVAYAADAAANAAYAAANVANADAYIERDSVLKEYCECVVQILIEMKAPGCEFLYLTENN